jgi:hypothetical protein
MLGNSFEEASTDGSSDDEWVSDLRDRADADFSLGKRYFEYYLFMNIVKESSGNEPAAMLEVRVFRAFWPFTNEFDSPSCMKGCTTFLLSRTSNFFKISSLDGSGATLTSTTKI